MSAMQLPLCPVCNDPGRRWAVDRPIGDCMATSISPAGLGATEFHEGEASDDEVDWRADCEGCGAEFWLTPHQGEDPAVAEAVFTAFAELLREP